MSNDETKRTKYTYRKANEKDPMSKPVDFIFLSFDRELNGQECEQLSQEYLKTHYKMTLPGNPLTVDLRPAFRKSLPEITPQFSTDAD
jgi:hypothetical protein